MTVFFAIAWILWMIVAWNLWQSMTEQFGFNACIVPVMVCVCVSFVLAYFTCEFWWIALIFGLIFLFIKKK